MAVFNLPDGAGKAAGYAQAHNLPQYHFGYDGEVIAPDSRGFEMEMQSLSPPQFPPVLVERSSVPASESDTRSPEVERLNGGRNERRTFRRNATMLTAGPTL